MSALGTCVSLEPCKIVAVDPNKMTATVRGLRNIGRMEVTWTDYVHPGTVGVKEDSHASGRIPQEGAIALVAAEWTDNQHRQFIRGYIIGYLPPVDINASEIGYNAGRNDTHEPRQAGDFAVTTSDRMQFSLSAGQAKCEASPGNYWHRSAEENTSYDVSDNKCHICGGLTEHSWSDIADTNTNVYRRVIRRSNSNLAKQDYRDENDRQEYLSDKNIDSTVIEEIGNVTDDFKLTSDKAVVSQSPIVYKLTVLSKGVPVYMKTIDAAGNIHEQTVANKVTVVGQLYRRVQDILEWITRTASSEGHGGGGAIWDFFAQRVNFWKR